MLRPTKIQRRRTQWSPETDGSLLRPDVTFVVDYMGVKKQLPVYLVFLV